MNKYHSPVAGINAAIILTIAFLGKYKFKLGITIKTLNSQYKKLAVNVAIPTPASPSFGINTKFNATPMIPEINLIVNSICVLLAKWYCQVV